MNNNKMKKIIKVIMIKLINSKNKIKFNNLKLKRMKKSFLINKLNKID